MVLRVQPLNHSGGESEEDPPVPIPNTEVKLLSVEDTWRETARKNRLLPLYMLKASRKGAFFVLLFYLMRDYLLVQYTAGNAPRCRSSCSHKRMNNARGVLHCKTHLLQSMYCPYKPIKNGRLSACPALLSCFFKNLTSLSVNDVNVICISLVFIVYLLSYSHS